MSSLNDEEILKYFEGRAQQMRAQPLDERKRLRIVAREVRWEKTYSSLITGCFGGPNAKELLEQELDYDYGEDSR
jgi:hypothetical protein